VHLRFLELPFIPRVSVLIERLSFWH
jgi:hypothetical protein